MYSILLKISFWSTVFGTWYVRITLHWWSSSHVQQQIRLCSPCQKGGTSHCNHTFMCYIAMPLQQSHYLTNSRKCCLLFVVSAINFIRGQALNHCLFKVFCNEVEVQHNVLLYHTEVRWLPRGWVLIRVFELRKKIKQFLIHRNSDIALEVRVWKRRVHHVPGIPCRYIQQR